MCLLLLLYYYYSKTKAWPITQHQELERMTNITSSSISTSSSTTELDYVYWPFGIISVYCFCVGVPISCFTLTYFIAKNKYRPTYVCLLYVVMNTVDLMICLLCFPMAITNLTGRKQLFYSINFLCSMWGYLWQILTRLSVFSVGLMSFCRTISLSLPFVRLSKQHLLIPAIIYLAILMVLQSIPWWFAKNYFFTRSLMCGWAIWFDKKTVEHKVLHTFLILLPFILPLLLIVISCLISVVKLTTDTTNCDSGLTKVGNEHVKRAKRTKRSATITIVILTVVYIIFNVPYCLLMFDHFLSDGNTNVIQSWLGLYDSTYHTEIYAFLTLYAIPINSTLNPIIYILRIRNLRRYIWNLLRCRGGNSTLTQSQSTHTVWRKVWSNQSIGT